MTPNLHLATYYADGQPVISFEVYPPKTDKGMRKLKESTLAALIELGPRFMTVTYGAGGSTRDKSIDVARHLCRDHGMNTACHLTCVGASRADLDTIIADIRGAGIDNIVALRGDPPRGEESFTPPADGYAHANELVEHIRRFERERGLTPAGIAVAGYPEKHLEAPDMKTDLQHLRRKVEAGADAVVTQLFYDNSYFFDFQRQTDAFGIDAPIVPGLLPALNGKQVRKMTAMGGSRTPPDLLQKLDDAGDDSAKALDVGIEHCIAQARGLLEHGVAGIHFYVLNRADHMRRIMAGIADLLPA